MKHFLTVTTVACIAALFFTSNTAQAQIAWSKVYTSNYEFSLFCETPTNIFCMRAGRFVMKSTNKGASWTQITPATYPITNYNGIAAYGNNLYLVNFTNIYPYAGKGFFVSTDQGANWTMKNNGLGVDTVLVGIQVTLNGTIFVTSVSRVGNTDSYKLYRSTDGGNNWTYSKTSAYGFAIDENSNGVYFLTDDSNMYTSTNFGVTWTTLTQTTNVVSLAVIIASNDSLYVQNGQSMLHSKDGINWKSRSSTGWPVSQFSSNYFITPNDTIYSSIATTPSTDYGVYMSPDLGRTWTKINTGLPTNPQILPGDMGFSKNTGYLFVSATSANIWRTTTPVYTPKSPPLSTIDYTDKYNLTISPNPAANTTRITYTLNASDAVTIEITDNTGKSVKTITFNETQSAGLHEPMIDLSGMKPGMYLISVRSSGGGSVQKLVVN